jgi:hypothetical protein
MITSPHENISNLKSSYGALETFRQLRMSKGASIRKKRKGKKKHASVVQVSMLIEKVVLKQGGRWGPEWMGLPRCHQDPSRHLLQRIEAPVRAFLMQNYGLLIT